MCVQASADGQQVVIRQTLSFRSFAAESKSYMYGNTSQSDNLVGVSFVDVTGLQLKNYVSIASLTG